jgi:hypothetical protein
VTAFVREEAANTVRGVAAAAGEVDDDELEQPTETTATANRTTARRTVSIKTPPP